ncbi:hypothetical protein CsSME_00053127 [Camellia sinensis var. sinensis]
MRQTERYTLEEMIDYMIGWDSAGFRGEGDYTEYIQAYLMPPLTGPHGAERERPAAPAVGVEVWTAAWAHGRSGSRREQRGEWPSLPTMMTCQGQDGETYQIPIAPHPPDHELVGFYGLPLNTDVSNTLADFRRVHSTVFGVDHLRDGDVVAEPQPASYLQYFALDTRPSRHLLHCNPQTAHSIAYDINTLHSVTIPAAGGTLAGPFASTKGGGRARRGTVVHPRTKAGRTHVGSSSRAPITDDDESETEAEQSHRRMRLEMIRARAQMVELAMMLLDLRPGRGRGQTTMPETS